MSPPAERLGVSGPVSAAPRSVSMVRKELSAALADARVDATRRFDIGLVMTEAAGNAIQHAYTPMPPGLLFIDAAIMGRNLLLRVCDVGRGIRRHAENPGLGIGLSLMTRLADGTRSRPTGRSAARACPRSSGRSRRPTRCGRGSAGGARTRSCCASTSTRSRPWATSSRPTRTRCSPRPSRRSSTPIACGPSGTTQLRTTPAGSRAASTRRLRAARMPSAEQHQARDREADDVSPADARRPGQQRRG